MMFYDFGNGSQELSLHQKLPTPKQLYFYILWIGCKDMLFEMFEMFFFSWEPFPGDVKSIKEFEFSGFFLKCLHWETGMALKTKLFKAIVLHLVNNYINLRQQISYIHRRHVPIMQSLVYLQTFLELMIYVGANMFLLLEIN